MSSCLQGQKKFPHERVCGGYKLWESVWFLLDFHLDVHFLLPRVSVCVCVCMCVLLPRLCVYVVVKVVCACVSLASSAMCVCYGEGCVLWRLCVCVCVLVKGVCVCVLGKVGSSSGLTPPLDLMCVTWLCRQNVELLLSYQWTSSTSASYFC